MSAFHSLSIHSTRIEARDTLVVRFAVPDDLREVFHFTQGQYLTLRAQIENEEVRRSYSICSAVQDGTLEVAIKKISDGLFSNWAAQHLKAGVAIDVMPPIGKFFTPLATENKKHYLAFCAGSGITPIFSIIKTTLLTEPQSRFTLVYGNRASSTMIFRTALSDLKDQYMDRFNFINVMTREQQDAELFNGRIDAEKCQSLCQHWINLNDIDQTFICGPEQMTEEVASTLVKLGLDKTKIKTELFGTQTSTKTRRIESVRAHSDTHCDVTVVLDGRQFTFSMEKDKQSVLEAGLSQGLDLRYSCKGGVCSTCRCKVTEGKVDMDMNYALEDYEIARGFVLSCQSFPATNTLTIDFDQEN
jgi:ring-1,2-phenylacetyl-CoA epoxidase subunit PaaE